MLLPPPPKIKSQNKHLVQDGMAGKLETLQKDARLES